MTVPPDRIRDLVAAHDDWELAEMYLRLQERMGVALREIIGNAYNLLTQGESPTQRRQPSAQRIYDRSKAALAEVER